MGAVQRVLRIAGQHTMNQLMERMCSISNCCVSSRDTRERSEQSPLFERRCARHALRARACAAPETPVLPLTRTPPVPTRAATRFPPHRSRRLRDKNRRGVDATRNGDIDGRGFIYADYDFDPSTQSQVCRFCPCACVRPALRRPARPPACKHGECLSVRHGAANSMLPPCPCVSLSTCARRAHLRKTRPMAPACLSPPCSRLR